MNGDNDLVHTCNVDIYFSEFCKYLTSHMSNLTLEAFLDVSLQNFYSYNTLAHSCLVLVYSNKQTNKLIITAGIVIIQQKIVSTTMISWHVLLLFLLVLSVLVVRLQAQAMPPPLDPEPPVVT